MSVSDIDIKLLELLMSINIERLKITDEIV